MRKSVIIGCAIVLTASVLYAKSSKNNSSDNCPYCGTGTPVIITPDPDPIVIEVDECAYCGNSTSSSTIWNPGSSWSRSATRSTYIVSEDGAYVGTATITTSKKSKAGKVSVKVVFKIGGKSYTAKKTAFKVDEDGTITAKWSNVKNIGAVSLTLTTDGEMSGTAGVYEFADDYGTGTGDSDDYDDLDDYDEDDGEVFVHGEHSFSVEVDDYTLNEKYELLDETIPTGVEVITNSKKWSCGKTPSIKYKKVDGEYVLTGLDDENKTNVSGLKITFNAKKNTFSGSFKVYATNEGSIEKGKPKLKSYKFKVTGSVRGGVLVGTATCKSLKATWTVVVD